MGGDYTDGERLAKLETEVSFIKDTVLDLKKMLMFREENYVTNAILDEKMKNVSAELAINKNAINELKRDFESYKVDQQNNTNIKKQTAPNWWQVIIALCSLASTVAIGILAIVK